MSQLFKVFAVDDDPVVLGVMQAILEPDCQLRLFGSAEDCLEQLQSEQPDLFFLDVNLPGMNGFALCREIKNDVALRNTPVMFVSGCDSIEERIKGYDAGGEDFIVKPFEPEEPLRKLLLAQHLVLDQRCLTEQIAEAELLSSLVMANMDETGILLQFMSKLIAMESTAEISTELLELLRRYGLDGGVQTRIGSATQTQSAAGSSETLARSAPLHDIGKVGIPDHILLKPGKLTPSESEIMKTHTLLGNEAITLDERDLEASVEFLARTKEIVRWHHERWDGSGYPDGLAGDDIPLSARLMAVADAFDALISKRAYKEALPFAEVRRIIAAGRGSQFDADIADSFLEGCQEFEAIALHYGIDK